ncbi:hypothetical protein ASPZODRAFT_137252 [Penicilliopsis zonata CBS 506.65]|uniref:ZIP zinc/iron transport family n=1 Tax=Penicilliopsis zonata CBS 506.65 TaxID=1073090 RepID=A0A1L9S5K5_9EURO|nr:hypothetical protein ASPZODRAFT_137252 [Penicilliopsis zonata CBS 506.65]OJJ42438.1 hypothetical protein ASPZODRAFT_137252 [Penicilliopsis zonata CBS 506.65]
MSTFDPTNVDLTTAKLADVLCYLYSGADDGADYLGARISSVFVILITSTVVTFFPVVAKRVRRLKIPNTAYLVARYFGSGVILATAFVHLLDPAYYEIGQNTCVGATGNWAQYSWPPAFALLCIVITFLLDFGASLYVERKYGIRHTHDEPVARYIAHDEEAAGAAQEEETSTNTSSTDEKALENEKSVQQQLAAFLILEFGVLFHSVIIGLTLGIVGSEFKVLYIVIIFHQAFEGLGIGARMSSIPFRPTSWLPWLLCSAYGLTTPISIAIGLAVRESLNLNSFNAMIVEGILDASSGGVLIYTSLVELIAHDFIFNPNRTSDPKELAVILTSFLAGIAIMSLLGKWI